MYELDEILEALEDTKREIEQLEDQLEWYTSDILLEKIDRAIELCKAKQDAEAPFAGH